MNSVCISVPSCRSDDIPVEDTSRLQLTIVPQPIQMGSTPTEHQVAIPAEKSIILAHRQEEGEEQIEEYIESNNPEYAMTKENLSKIEKEITDSRKRNAVQEKGKGKHNIILTESEDKE